MTIKKTIQKIVNELIKNGEFRVEISSLNISQNSGSKCGTLSLISRSKTELVQFSKRFCNGNTIERCIRIEEPRLRISDTMHLLTVVVRFDVKGLNEYNRKQNQDYEDDDEWSDEGEGEEDEDDERENNRPVRRTSRGGRSVRRRRRRRGGNKIISGITNINVITILVIVLLFFFVFFYVL